MVRQPNNSHSNLLRSQNGPERAGDEAGDLMDVDIEDNAVPIVRVIAAMARRSLAQPSVAKLARRAKGTAVLQSMTDPQAVTAHFDGKVVRLERGASEAADVTIVADLADDSVKPQLSGVARHPVLAMAMGKLLEPPTGEWRDEAERFMAKALADATCPRPLRLVATDGTDSQQWGGEGEPAMEIHGTGEQLAAAMSGSTLVAEEILNGNLKLVGDLRDLSVLTRFNIDQLFGEL